MSQQTKKKSKKNKPRSWRPSKSADLTIEAIEEMFPHFTPSEIIEWSIIALRQTMLKDEPLLPKKIRMKIVRAEITSLEQEMKEDKYAIIHSTNRANKWIEYYEAIQKGTIQGHSMTPLKESGVLPIWIEKNKRILELSKEYQKLLANEQRQKIDKGESDHE